MTPPGATPPAPAAAGGFVPGHLLAARDRMVSCLGPDEQAEAVARDQRDLGVLGGQPERQRRRPEPDDRTVAQRRAQHRDAVDAGAVAAAEVAQNGLKPGVEVAPQSAAATSGFSTSSTPVAERSPGVIAAPFGW